MSKRKATAMDTTDGFHFHILDVFTTGRPMSGNQLLVLEDHDNTLSTAAMQKIAQEIGFAESAFVRQPASGCAASVRIFTTDAEVPQAGHPLVGRDPAILRRHPHFARTVFECGDTAAR